MLNLLWIKDKGIALQSHMLHKEQGFYILKDWEFFPRRRGGSRGFYGALKAISVATKKRPCDLEGGKLLCHYRPFRFLSFKALGYLGSWPHMQSPGVLIHVAGCGWT